ncbi:hypothetical protein L596_002618 [Steinernema carpocapsae]|uniref:Uncharacterized protein n=1 Tax=Steinernema carpocapsae TaxID=34508 RepID=A0A4U8UQ23_STECR|nr:hypothetical protein L596_002618 [Steinernema carpocapsae]
MDASLGATFRYAREPHVMVSSEGDVSPGCDLSFPIMNRLDPVYFMSSPLSGNYIQINAVFPFRPALLYQRINAALQLFLYRQSPLVI